MKTIRILLLCLFFQNGLNGQSFSALIHGYNNEPITGVQVLNLSTGNHTHSDEQGMFYIQHAHLRDTLKLSHIGYENILYVIQTFDSPAPVILKEKSFSLEELVISPNINALNMITDIDIQTHPVNSSQDILRQIPGLFIGQHAGGGKAEQIFLRGFDIDHGTDIAITVDGIPVNLVSHAHGQGYADLHFVIPETTNKIDFGKGPYYANKGNFNTAGYVDFQTKERLQTSAIKLEIGQFNTQRLLGMFNVLNTDKHSGYLASDYQTTDGPFESPQNFNRINLLGKYTGNISRSEKLSFTLSHFNSKWDASGQIPQRAVDDGTISRFGAIDDTEGGNTTRTNILAEYEKVINENSHIKNRIFYSTYDFELYSNFTFYLEDSINGDQIKQKESRTIFGVQSDYNQSFSSPSVNGDWQVGISLRYDQINGNELSHTLNRQYTLNTVKLGNINESNMAGYVGLHLNVGRWTFNPSLRLDYLEFQYNDDLRTHYRTQSVSNTIFSPKLNVLYNQSKNLQFYLKGGKGFHSNDTRVVVESNGDKILPAAYGYDAGFLWKPVSKLLINTAYWYLFLEQEFVYVGDAGIVEPSGQTSRQGIDLSVRYQPIKWLFWNLDANYALAQSIGEPKDENYIPLAPNFTTTTGLSVIHPSHVYGGANLRFMNKRPANEDYSIVAKGYTVIDFNAGYKWKNLDFGFQIQNLLNTAWNETQFATTSRLKDEPTPVEEIHFTPGTPFFLKLFITYLF